MKLRTYCIVCLFCAAAGITVSAQVLITLHNFCSQTDCTDGTNPYGTLLKATDGNLYGTTEAGGPGGYGTVFKVTPSGTLTTLHTFVYTDGAEPYAGLVQGTDGNFYGTTYTGGAHSYGTVYRMTASGTVTTLYSFCSQYWCADGARPVAPLVQASDGNFYGTTVTGGAHEYYGTVFKITPSGTLTTLYSFCSETNCTDGAWPYGGLIQASSGMLYGTTLRFGVNGDNGTVYKMDPTAPPGEGMSVLHYFSGTDGAYPYGGLVQGTDGNFYGTTYYGGVDNGNSGTVFKITPSGVTTTLYIFCSLILNGPPCGDHPYAGLLLGTDGNFYGTTWFGGTNGGSDGTVFKITASGTLTWLHSFAGTDGQYPAGGLVQGADGNLYGTTTVGGADQFGTVFRLGPLHRCLTCGQ
ncbi:MAG: choice-of-anchor tandem repeat GloVer-containing protein [Candidatus Korobacteraceae bacterium]|jgi:uncharacterized repeat protein (TIGR03803 family)